MEKIYLVCGRSGEFSDKCEWNVKAFHKKLEAEHFRGLLQSHAKAFLENQIEDEKKELLKSLDMQGFWYWHEDVAYLVEEIPFVE